MITAKLKWMINDDQISNCSKAELSGMTESEIEMQRKQKGCGFRNIKI